MLRSKSSKTYPANGWLGWLIAGNNTTSWLLLASRNLPDSQLSWESKREPSAAILILLFIFLIIIYCYSPQVMDWLRILATISSEMQKIMRRGNDKLQSWARSFEMYFCPISIQRFWRFRLCQQIGESWKYTKYKATKIPLNFWMFWKHPLVISRKNWMKAGFKFRFVSKFNTLRTRVRHLLIFQYRSKNDKKIVRANVPRNHEKNNTHGQTREKIPE